MKVTKFGNIVREVKVNVDRDNNPYEFYIAGDHMDSEDLTIHRKGKFSTDDVGPAFTRIFKPGQILYGSRRTYLKKIAVADFEGICANTTFVLETKDDNVFLQSLLPFIMLSNKFTEWSVSHSKGSTNPYVLFSDLASYEFDLPPLEEQRVLAEKLWAAYRLKESYKRLLAATDEMVKSQFIEMFGDPVTNSKGWETGKIKDVAPETPSKKQLSGKVWLLNLDMIESNTGKVIEKVYENVENALSVQPFDEDNVLFSKLRPYLNKVVIPNEVGLATTELVPLRPNPSKLNKVFLSHLLRSDQFVNYADDIAGGTKMPRMPLSELRNFECILPPMDTQMQFVFIAEQADKSKFVSFKSQFIEMFGDVEKKPFVDVCISKGEYGSNSPADDYDGNIRYVRITDITEEGNLNGVVVSPRKVEEKYMLLQDDLLFARTGNTVGKTYLHKSGKMVFAGYLIRYRLNKKLMLPQFAFAYTHTNQYYDWVEKIKKVGAQPNISAAQYDSMPILVPSMAKQIEFVAIAKQADKSKYYN